MIQRKDQTSIATNGEIGDDPGARQSPGVRPVPAPSSLMGAAVSLAASMATFAASGFKTVDQPLHELRTGHCGACEYRHEHPMLALPLLHCQEGMAAPRGLPHRALANVMPVVEVADGSDRWKPSPSPLPEAGGPLRLAANSLLTAEPTTSTTPPAARQTGRSGGRVAAWAAVPGNPPSPRAWGGMPLPSAATAQGPFFQLHQQRLYHVHHAQNRIALPGKVLHQARKGGQAGGLDHGNRGKAPQELQVRAELDVLVGGSAGLTAMDYLRAQRDRTPGTGRAGRRGRKQRRSRAASRRRAASSCFRSALSRRSSTRYWRTASGWLCFHTSGSKRS